jgi:TonB family protein
LYAKGYQVSAEYFDEEGKPLTDTTGVNREATMKGGEAAWKKYLEKKLYWPTGLQFTTPATVTVGISFVIDENGKVTDAEVSMPFHEAFDKIALKVIQNSADWQPAVVNNRKVKAYRVQPVNFAQPD